MTLRSMLRAAWLATALATGWCTGAHAQAATGDSNARSGDGAIGTPILDTYSFWRVHETLQPPVIRGEGGSLKPLVLKQPWVDSNTAGPDANWMAPGFDDHRWLRGPVRLAAPSPFTARLSLRGKFNVTDAAKVKLLKLSLSYHGGAIVYVNGQEVARPNVPAGQAELAEDYPAEAYVDQGGKLLSHDRRQAGPGSPQAKIIQRSADIEIPAKALRTGVNVIAIDLLRAPYPKVLEEKKDPTQAWWIPGWDNCQIDQVRLSADGAEGLVPNVARPEGFQVWNASVVACDYDLDWGDPCEKVQPIEIVGARGGVFSGKVVVGSSKPIQGLKAAVGDLRGPGGLIAASQTETRFAVPWASEHMSLGVNPYPTDVTLLSCLLPQAPAETPLSKKKLAARKPGDVEIVNGAVVPVWTIVCVPKDAKPGTYKGELTIQATGEKPIVVPVEVKVADWTIPDPQDHRAHVEILQSPDTLAAEYKVPLWSEEHWKLIGESFRLMSDSGSRVLHIPLIAETNLGHEQTMVRWVKKARAPGSAAATQPADSGSAELAASQYDYDFTLFDKYLDVAEKNLGKPKIVILYVWDVYMMERGREAVAGQMDERFHREREAAGQAPITGRPPMVTLLDPATGKMENMAVPQYKDPASEALWKPLWDQLRQRMAKRGLEGAMKLGLMTDVLPSKAEAAFWAKIAPGVPWAVHSHSYNFGSTLYNLAKVDYRLGIWGVNDAVTKSLMGWKREDLMDRFWKQWGFNAFPTSTWRELCEQAICGDQRGVGRLGGDFWEVYRDKNGQRKGFIYARYPQSMWRDLNIYVSLLAPGPAGPAPTAAPWSTSPKACRLCEARIAVEKALSDPAAKAKLGEDLVGRCQKLLDERMRAMQLCFCMLNYWMEGTPAHLGSTGGPAVPSHYWYIGSDWEGRDAALYGLAGEVAPETRFAAVAVCLSSGRTCGRHCCGVCSGGSAARLRTAQPWHLRLSRGFSGAGHA